jgi:hypothetical protein
MDIILHHHSKALQQVKIKELMSESDVRNLSQSCRNLRSLRLRIPRTCGDENEVRIYRLLGSLPCLERLALELYCVEDTNSDTELFERMREALKNAAVDARLALEIFHVILASNCSPRPDTISRFECLNIVVDIENDDQVDFPGVLDQMLLHVGGWI